MRAVSIFSALLFFVMSFNLSLYSYAIDGGEYTGSLIKFGSYPQSKVTDKYLYSNLMQAVPDSLFWNSYNYFSGTGSPTNGSMSAKNYMKYIDILYKGEKYRAVEFSKYRPTSTGFQSNYDYTYQDDNGYFINEVYFFKFEPIKWRILDYEDGLILSENIIDSQSFNNYMLQRYQNGKYYYYGNIFCTYYASDFEKSSVRQWLNDDFYITAFSADEKAKIFLSKCENTSTYNAIYDVNETNDNVFLLSFGDALNINYGFSSNSSNYDTARTAQGTDYAKCQGLYVYTDEKYNGNSNWRLRSPFSSNDTRCVDYNGFVGNSYGCESNIHGIRPAIRADLKSMDYIITSLDCNGGQVSREYLFSHKGDRYEFPAPAREGYTFDGWFDRKTGGNRYTNNSIVSLNDPITFYAHWTPVKTKVYFNSNGGECEFYSKDVTYDTCYGELPAAVRKGHSFAGWYDEEEGGNKYTYDTVCRQTGIKTLYAHWELLKTKVYFNSNGGECDYYNKDVTYKMPYGSMPTGKRKGYDFVGWFTQEEGGIQYFEDTVCWQTEAKTLYAHWKPVTCNVFFDANGGSCSVKSKQVTYKSTYGKLPVATRKNYEFVGWYSSPDGGKEYTQNTVSCQTEDITLYALWTQMKNFVKSVKLTDCEFYYKDTMALNPVITADPGAKYTVSYSSSDEKVLTVDKNGIMHSNKRGKAKVTCTVKDSYSNIVSDTCEVKVKYSFGQWLITILLFGWIWY